MVVGEVVTALVVVVVVTVVLGSGMVVVAVVGRMGIVVGSRLHREEWREWRKQCFWGEIIQSPFTRV